MQNRTVKSIINFSINIARVRQNIFPGLLRKYAYLKFIKSYKTRFAVSNYLLPFLPSLFVVDAISQLDSKTVIKEADNLYNEAKFEDLYSFLNDYRDSEDPEIMWRLARAIFEKCRSVKEDNEKLFYYEEALQLVNRALQINESCWAAHKWCAILLDYVWRCKSTKGRIIYSFDVKKHMERAIELNPEDSTSYYLLGEWCYTFADMPWYQRKVAAAIFASPPTSTYSEALQYFEKAEKTTPLFYSMNLLMMGKCFLRMNDKEKGVAFLKQAKDYPIKTADDQKAHEEAEKLLRDLNAL